MNSEELKTLASGIARCLGSDWHTETNENRLEHITGPSDLRLWLSLTWGPKGKLHIRGSYPDYIDRSGVYLKPATAINVNPDRGARVIAEEIERRLLPSFRLELAEALKAHIVNKQHKEGRQKTLLEAADILGTQPGGPDNLMLYSGGQIRIQVSGPDTIEQMYRVTLTVAQLRKLKEALPELFEHSKGEDQ